jgi:type I restriction enzyme S subunit
VALLRVKTESIVPQFLAVALLGGIHQARMIYDAGGTTIKHIYISRLGKMPVAYPTLSEQADVVRFLNKETAKLDGLISEAERAIELLQERRTALISAAVTGKIDVRNLGRTN